MKPVLSTTLRFILIAACLGWSSFNIHAFNITGNVTDTEGEPVIGASVTVLGTKTGVATDLDGNFTINADAGRTLRVSYIGCLPQDKKIVAGTTVYNFVLQTDATSLDEVVVVGYGTQKRSDLTGSISTVKGETFQNFAVNSVADALSGMAAGVSVTKSTGTPGEAPDIIIRGAASVNGMAPLYIVDGVKQSAGFDFNTRDIESIEVLKDAGSCAIYGSEAAGGVILITTKRGQQGAARLNVSARYGWRKIDNKFKLLNRDQFIAVKNLMGVDILAAEGVESASELPDVDWMDVMYDTGHEQEYNLSLSGGTEQLKYYVSGSFYDEKGTYYDSSANRFALRTNIDYKINPIFSMGTSVYGNIVTRNPTKTYSIYTNCIPFRTVPTMAPVDSDGNWCVTPSYLNGPNLFGNEDSYHYKGHDYNMTALAYINVNILPELVLRLNGAARWYFFDSRVFSEDFDFQPVKEDAYFESSAGNNHTYTFNGTLTYDKTFASVHNLKVMAGMELESYGAYTTGSRAIDFPVDVAWSSNLSSNTAKEAWDSPGVGRALSFFGRVNYNYASRYYLTFNIRRDGSDRFGKKHRWGTFPSFNLGWRLTQEKFMDNRPEWINDIKLRGGYGILGNDGIAQFLYTRSYVGDQILYNFGGNNEVSGWANYKVPNADIKWEEVHQTDFGIDISLLNNRLTFTYDFYNRQTRDMLYWRVVPLGGGMNWYYEGGAADNTMPINIGKVENIGHEFAVNWQSRVADFNYSVGVNASFNRNKVLEIGTEGAAPLMSGDGINRTENGHAMAMLYGYECVGMFTSQEQVDAYNARAREAGREYYWREQTGVGDLIFSDRLPDGTHQGFVNEDNKKFIGNPWPKMTLGLNLTGEWRGFDLTANFQGAFGFDIYNQVKGATQTFSSDGNTTMDIYTNSFFADNGLTDMPRCGYMDENGLWNGDPSGNFGTVSSFWVEKGDYLKLKNLVVGYTLPKALTRKICIDKLRVYFNASNLFTITHYSGIDPEIAGTSDQNKTVDIKARGVDTQFRYLPSRLFAIGLDITF